LATLILLAFLLLYGTARWIRLPRPRLSLPALALAAGLVLAPLSNLVIVGSFAFTPGGTSFLFGRLLQSGIVARYVTDRCPDPTLRLCAVRHRLPRTTDDWHWASDSPLHELGGWSAFEPEARRIIRESLTLYPGQHLVSAAAFTAQQLVTLRTGDGIRSRDNHHALSVFRRLAPGLVPRFEASRQQHDWFDFRALNAVQVPLALLCMGLLPLMIAVRRVPRSVAALAFTTLVALLANAAVCGIFSNPADRYQGRLAWLAPLVVMLAGLRSGTLSQVGAPARLP
jgi:hypothetical protein